MTPKLHLKRLASHWPAVNGSSPIVTIDLPIDYSGQPLYPKKDEIIQHEEAEYRVVMVIWNLESQTINVCAEEVVR